MNGKAILLVEDDADDEALTLRALRKNNVLNEVVVKRDGAQAIEYLLALHGEGIKGTGVLPALVLLDLKLPKVDGLEVLRRLRAGAETRMLPVVVLTSSTEEQDILKSYNLGANSYVRKPVDFDQFLEAVRQLGLYWLVLNVGPPSRGVPR
ncbi:MAG: response regulator [Chloroflexi bacterium]|nr:response regulator [Chloroflexota bacterium]